MSPSTMAGGRVTLIGAVALAAALLVAIPIVDSQTSQEEAGAHESAPSVSPSSPPASTKSPPDKQSLKPIRLSDGNVEVDGHVLTPASRAGAGGIDIRIFSPAYGKPWTGPWELDFSKLRIDHTATDVVITLSFAELNILEGWRNDVFRVYVDTKENPPGPLEWPASPYPAAEREVDFSVDPKLADGMVYRHRGDIGGPIRDCKFEASLHRASESVTVKAPRRCFDYPLQLRARAQFQSPRHGWEAWDSTGWTAFATMGESATTRDPALGAWHPE